MARQTEQHDNVKRLDEGRYTLPLDLEGSQVALGFKNQTTGKGVRVYLGKAGLDDLMKGLTLMRKNMA